MSETYVVRFAEHLTGSVYKLVKEYTHLREPRVRPGVPVNVWLGDEIVGYIRRERRRHKGHGCWRWVGYEGGTSWSDRMVEIPDAMGTDRLGTARAVATHFLMKRMNAEKSKERE